MRSSSRAVNRYIEAKQKLVALALAHHTMSAEVQATRGALKGRQISEAAAILSDPLRLAAYPVVLKIKVAKVAKKTARADRCAACGGRGRVDNPGDILGTETCGACAGTGRAAKAVAS